MIFLIMNRGYVNNSCPFILNTFILVCMIYDLMYKQLSFVIAAAIMLTAVVTIALYGETAHAATYIIKKTTINKANATAGGANMTKK